MNFKILLLLLSLSCIALVASAQDTINLKNGLVRIGEVTEIGDDFVYYRGPSRGGVDSVMKLTRTDIYLVAYKNGYHEVFEQDEDASQPDLITLVNASEIKGRIIEVEEKNIIFKLSSYSSDSIRHLSIDSIASIRYANGYSEKYNDVRVKTLSGAPLMSETSVAGKLDSVKLLKGQVLVGYVTEIGEESVSIASGDIANPTIKQIPKEELRYIVYGNGYLENYSLPGTAITGNEEEPATGDKKPVKQEVSGSKKKSKSKDKEEEAPFVEPNLPRYEPEALAALPATISLKKTSSSQPVRKINLTSRNLNSLVDSIRSFDKLLVLHLDFNRFKEIPPVIYEMKSLYSLTIGNNVIKKVDDIPKGLDSNALAFVYMPNNQITSVDSRFFLLPNLQSVDLSTNQIKHLENVGKSDRITVRLASLNLSNNRLKDIPGVIGKMPGLSNLDISHNSIRSVDFSLLQKTKIENLDLSYNPISSLSPDFYDLKTLHLINLKGTKISVITDSISRLVDLTVIALPEGLKSIAPGIRKNQNIRELYLDNNPNITSFPAEFLALTRLEVLSLNGTAINRVPADISKLRRLKRLSLSNCNLSSVPVELFDLPRIQRIDLSGNRITSVPAKLGSLAQLEMLNLENSPVRGESLLRLKKALPYASIKYYSPELGLNYESKPVPQEYQPQFLELLEQCDQGNTEACYELGRFFENNRDYGLAIKQYFRIAEELTKPGSAQHALAYFRVAELYNDADNSKSYNSIYKRRAYTDYSDYQSNKANNKSLIIYCKLCEEEAADANAYKTMQQSCAKAALIYNELQKNLTKLYEFNRNEVERLVGGAGTMANVKAGGDYLLSTSTTQGASVAGGLFSLIGTVGKAAKESKAERIQKETLRLKDEIEDLRKLEEYYLNKKP